MTSKQASDRIVATDYYDGPLEGFARAAGACFYFLRESDDDAEAVSQYRYVPIDVHLFNQIEVAVGAAESPSRVYVYVGDIDRANNLVDSAIADARSRIKLAGKSATGRDFFDALRA